MVSGWIEVCWVHEFSIVIFGIQFCLSSLTHLNEVSNVLSVSEVLVKVIFKVLDQVHMVLDQVIPSDSVKGESMVVELPGMYRNFWVFPFFKKFIVNEFCVSISLLVKSSGEEIKFNV